MLSVSTQFTSTDSKDKFEKMLDSVSFADEIVVFAYQSADLSYLQDISSKYPLKVKKIRDVMIVEEIRSSQIRQPRGKWVLVLDFDEIVTPKLAQEIQSVVQGNPCVYAVKRRNYSLGMPLRYGGWGDDYVIRLFHQDVFQDWPTNIHSTPKFKGELIKLTNYLEHHKDDSIAYMVRKTNRYSDIEANLFYKGNLPPVTSFTLVRKSVMEFLRRYIFKLGFLDGRIGLIQGLYQAYSVFISYTKLYELQQKKT